MIRCVLLFGVFLSCSHEGAGPSPVFRGDLYENGGLLTATQIKAVLDECPLTVWCAVDSDCPTGQSCADDVCACAEPPCEDWIPFNVRHMSAPQPSGVDLRVEFSSFASHEVADCFEAVLLKQGVDEIETDTVFGDYPGPVDGSSTT